MKIAPYPEYEPTDVQWLQQLPSHWQAKRLKTVATYYVSNVDKVPADDEQPVQLCNYTDVYYNDYIRPNMGLMETTATADEIRKFGLRVNDVVITKDSEDWSDIAVPAMVAETAPDLVCGYHLAIIRPSAEQLYGPFLLRLFQSSAINQQFQIAASGVTRYGLPKSAIAEAWLPLPSFDEQQTIARFLDAKTAQIDTLVAKKRQLIDKLKEKRSALIARTVTRGLPPEAAKAAGLEPNPVMKDSGVEWLGKIPAHWRPMRAKHLCTAIVDCKNRTPEYFDDGEFLVARTTDVRDGKIVFEQMNRTDEENFRIWTERGAPQANDVFFTREAPAGEAAIFDGSQPVCLGQRMMYFRPDAKRLDPRYLVNWIYGSAARGYIDSLSGGSTVTHLRVGQVHDFPVATPPLSEQAAIVEYLASKTSELDTLMGQAFEAISLLIEYRQALITSAVTGKIDVRNHEHMGATSHAPVALS